MNRQTRQPDQRQYGEDTQEARLLAGWYETRRPARLDEHLQRYGPAPAHRGRHRDHPLIDAADQAGLTGRGGAAFPTGRKLRAVAAGRGPAVVVANGMESEPASRKDQTLLALAPHLVLDGIALAAAAVGAGQAHLCLPRDRPRLIESLTAAVDDRDRRSLDTVPVTVHALPHHYVSSEETSLIRWLGGGDARPASVPPRPFERGLGGRPTLVDNVETLAHLALIARFGPAWFRRRGTPQAPGTPLVTLSGAVAEPGVREVSLGAGLLDVLALGGAAEPVQAVLVGGFFGSWHTRHEASQLAYTAPAIAAAGGGIGAGVVVALPDGACGLAETARVVEFLAAQSAGQCGPCRFGLPAVARDLADLAWTRVGQQQRRRLEERITLLVGRGACKHPDGVARLAASALRVFADEARQHLAHGPCQAAQSNVRVLTVPPPTPIAPRDWR